MHGGWFRRASSRWIVGALVAAVLTAGSAAASAPPEGSDPADTAVGDAVAIAPGVEWRAGAGGSYSPVAATQPVAVGDGVRTDATGFAEVAYLDGSRTRLDVDTEFEVVALTDDAGNAVTRTQMGLGRTWHRVQAVGAASGGFEVETSQAVATVRGTAFLVSCPTVESCDYSVMEGVVDVALADGSVVTVTAPATLDVTDGVATGPVPLTWDGLFGDPWLVDNTDRDVAAGFADRASVYQAYGPAFASMVGTYDVTTTVSAVTCVEACQDQVGDGVSFSAEYSTQCEAGACVLVGNAGIPYAFDGVTYSMSLPGTEYCYEDADGDDVRDDGEPILTEFPVSADVFVAPSAAEVRGDGYVVTTFVWHRVYTADTQGYPCVASDGGVYLGETVMDDGTGTRTG